MLSGLFALAIGVVRIASLANCSNDLNFSVAMGSDMNLRSDESAIVINLRWRGGTTTHCWVWLCSGARALLTKISADSRSWCLEMHITTIEL